MTRTRVGDDGTVTEGEILADDHGNGKLYLAVDADIEVGDIVEYALPNGKPRILKITEHNVMQAPGGMNMGPSLDHTKCVYEVVTRKPVDQPQQINLPGLHPLISQASGSQVAVKHFDNAVSNACQAVEDRVQALTGYPKTSKGAALSGKPLMSTVFSPQAPALDITSDNVGEVQRADEIEGYMYLFMGVAQALRNPRGHGPKLNTSEPEAMEVLATASLLMRALDRAESRLPQPRHKPPIKKLPRGIGRATGQA